MIITEKEIIKISLNTHGGVILWFSWGHIWNTIGGKWAITVKQATKNKQSVIKTFDFISQAYLWGKENLGEKNER